MEKMTMKKKMPIIIGTILIIAVITILFIVNKPYKPNSFVVDGENYLAAVENGDSLILNLDNDDENGEWLIALSSEFFASDYSNVIERGTEFHIIALTDGKGEMVFHHIKGDGTIEKYTLTLSISRHQKTNLQIDTISFTEYE